MSYDNKIWNCMTTWLPGLVCGIAPSLRGGLKEAINSDFNKEMHEWTHDEPMWRISEKEKAVT